MGTKERETYMRKLICQFCRISRKRLTRTCINRTSQYLLVFEVIRIETLVEGKS